MQTEPLSCWPLHTRYGNALSVVTWYTAAVGWLYQLLHDSPPFSETIAPWSADSAMISGVLGLIHSRW